MWNQCCILVLVDRVLFQVRLRLSESEFPDVHASLAEWISNFHQVRTFWVPDGHSSCNFLKININHVLWYLSSTKNTILRHSLYYIPCTIFLVLYSLYYIPCTVFLVLYSLYYIPCTILYKLQRLPKTGSCIIIECIFSSPGSVDPRSILISVFLVLCIGLYIAKVCFNIWMGYIPPAYDEFTNIEDQAPSADDDAKVSVPCLNQQSSGMQLFRWSADFLFFLFKTVP